MNRRKFVLSLSGIAVMYKSLSYPHQPAIASEISLNNKEEIEIHSDFNTENLSILLDFDFINIQSQNMQTEDSINLIIKSGVDKLEKIKKFSNISIPKNGEKDISSSIESINIINENILDFLTEMNEGDEITVKISIEIENSEIDTKEIKKEFSITMIGPKKKAIIKKSETDTLIDNDITFSAENSITGSNPKYEWDLGDGTIKQGEKITHSYSESGLYSVELTIRDDSTEYSDTVEINISIPSNLVGYWRFNESKNSDKLIDYSGNENHGNLYGGITQEVKGHKEDELAYRYDGSSGYITVPDVEGYEGDELTFTAWVNIETNNTSSIMDMHDFQDVGDGGEGKIHIEQNDSGYFRVTLKDDSGNDVIDMTNSPLLTQDEWKFIVIRYDGENAEVSYDGEVKDEDTGSSDIASTQDFQFGMHKEGRWFDGRISEIRIYNEFLTDEQLKNVRDGGEL